MNLDELDGPELLCRSRFDLIELQYIVLSIDRGLHLLGIGFLKFEARFCILYHSFKDKFSELCGVNRGCLLVYIRSFEGLVFLEMRFTLALTVHSVPAKAVKALFSQSRSPERVHVCFVLHFRCHSSTLFEGLAPRK
jgi:hypothetical protein